MVIALTILGVLISLLVIAISVGLHEAGHMVVAKFFKLKVPDFFVGFGPKLFSFSTKATRYGVRAIPLGGYVQIIDENDDEETTKGKGEHPPLSKVAPWKRQLIFAAGPVVNIILGFLILIPVLMINPYMQASTTVEAVNAECSTGACGAQEAGMLPGDKVTEVNGLAVEELEDISAAIPPGATAVDLTVERAGESIELESVAVTDGKIGVHVELIAIDRNFFQAVGTVVDVVGESAVAITHIPEKIPGVVSAIFGQSERADDSPASVVAVSRSYGEVASSTILPVDDKVTMMFTYAGLLNVGLGLLNLLPIGMLDGGRMLVAFLDSCRGAWAKLRRTTYRPTSSLVVRIITVPTTLMLVGFMMLLIVADVVAPISTQ